MIWGLQPRVHILLRAIPLTTIDAFTWAVPNLGCICFIPECTSTHRMMGVVWLGMVFLLGEGGADSRVKVRQRLYQEVSCKFWFGSS